MPKRPLKSKKIRPIVQIWLDLKRQEHQVIPLWGFRRPVKHWPDIPNDEASIRKWSGDGAALRTQGSDSGYVDIDVGIEAVRDDIIRMIEARWPGFGRECLRRHSGGVRLMLIGRVVTDLKHLRSSRWKHPDDDPQDKKGHMVEIFTPNDRRYVGVWGPHSPGREYGFIGRTLMETPQASLPEFPGDDLGAMLEECDRIFAAHGMVKIEDASRPGGGTQRVHDLEPDQVWRQADDTEIVLKELAEVAGGERIAGYANLWDPQSTTPDRVLANMSSDGLALWDSKTNISHRWASAAPVDREKLGALLKTLAATTTSSMFTSTIVKQLNERYCIVCDGGQTRVLTFEPQVQKVGNRIHVRHVATFMRFQDFVDFYLDVKVMVGKSKWMPLGKWWLQSTKAANPNKLKFDGIVFRPDIDLSVVDGKLNLWRGFGVEEQPGDWSLMRQHIEQVLANGNKAHAEYILNWIAWTVQNPADRAEVALVFRGKKGVGKGMLGNAMVILFGRHGIHISSKDHLAGRFNQHLRDCCMLFADEAYWPGDKSAEGALNRLITEPDLFIEPKFKNAFAADNLLHVIIASNEEWVVPAGENERRYAIFDVPDSKMQNHAYFAAIVNQMDGGGYEAMLHDLRRRELAGWHPRQLVASAALLSQQERSLGFFDEWWVGVLDNATVPGSIPKYPDCSAPMEDFMVLDSSYTQRETARLGLLSRARKTDPRRGHYVTEAAFGRKLRKAGCVKTKITYGKKQRRTWRFPALADARKAWEKRFPGWQWSEPDSTEWQADEVDAAPVDATAMGKAKALSHKLTVVTSTEN